MSSVTRRRTSGLAIVLGGILALLGGQVREATGVPTLLVTYGVGNDLFFSGHTALAVFGTLELGRVGHAGLKLTAIAIALCLSAGLGLSRLANFVAPSSASRMASY